MQDYSVPQHHIGWTSRIPAWLAWTLTLVISGVLFNSVGPLFNTLVGSSYSEWLVFAILAIVNLGLITVPHYYGFRALTGYQLGPFWPWIVLWLPLFLVHPFVFRESSVASAKHHFSNMVIGLLFGLWFGLWMLKMFPAKLRLEEITVWMGGHAFAYGAALLFYSLVITPTNMGETKTFDTFAPIYYIAHAIKWLIYALPTGVLFPWMLQRQIKRS